MPVTVTETEGEGEVTIEVITEVAEATVMVEVLGFNVFDFEL